MNAQPLPPPQPPPVAGATKTNTLAIVSLVLAVLGPLLAVPALVCAGLALGQIERSEGRQGGRQLAIAAIVVAAVMLVVLGGAVISVALYG